MKKYAGGLGEMLTIVKNNYDMLGAWETSLTALVFLIKNRWLNGRDDFDRRYGVHTSEEVEPSDAGIQDPELLRHAIAYVPVRERVLRTILRESIASLAVERTTFVDLGCGKGRALLMASQHPFDAIHGVELSESLVANARANVAHYLARKRHVGGLRCENIEVTCCSAPDYGYPDSDLLVYMYRPFTGLVLAATLDSLEHFHRSTGRRVSIVLCCPSDEDELSKHRGFRKLREYRVFYTEFSWVAYEAIGQSAASAQVEYAAL